jgi:putative salt-induced outer membrane protein
MKLSSLFFSIALIACLSAQAKFTNESEVSVIVSGGNTETQVYNGKTTNTYTKTKNTITFGGHYMYGTSFDTENARNWDLNTKYQRSLKKKLAAFLGVIVEGDEFAGIERRTNLDAGGAYTLFEEDKTKVYTELGYRYRKEKSISGTTLSQSQGRLFISGKKATKKNFSAKMWVEYLPNFTDSDDWQLNFEPSLQFNFYSNLALKWGYMGRYDNEPVLGNKKFDFLYTTSLIAQF